MELEEPANTAGNLPHNSDGSFDVISPSLISRHVFSLQNQPLAVHEEFTMFRCNADP